MRTALAGLGLTGLAAGFVMAAREIDEANSLIIRSTGATGEALLGLQRDVQEVWRSGPEGVRVVAEAVSDLNTRLGLTGEALQSTGRDVLDFARVTRQDAATAVRDLSQMANALEVQASDLPGVLDKLLFASQRSGIAVGDLTQGLTGAGMGFVELGFSVDKSIALFSQFEMVGARPADVIGSLNIALTNLAREGFTNAEEAFDELLGRIRDAPDFLTGTAIAADAFGARVGSKLAEEIRYGTFEVEAFVAELQGVTGVLAQTVADSRTLGESFATLRNEIGARLVPVLTTLVEWGQKLVDNFDLVTDAAVALGVALGTAGMTYAMVVLGKAVVGATGSLLAMEVGVLSLSGAFRALHVALGPTGWAVLGITAVTGAVFAWRRRNREAEESLLGLKEKTEQLNKTVAEQRALLGGMDDDALTAQLGVRKDAISQMEEQLREIQEQWHQTGPTQAVLDQYTALQQLLNQEKVTVEEIVALLERRNQEDANRPSNPGLTDEELKALEKKRSLLLEAVGLRVEEGDELRRVMARLEEVQRLQAAGVGDLEQRVKLRKEEMQIINVMESAARKHRSTLLDAIGLHVATRDEINQVRDRYVEIQGLLEDQTLEAEKRVALRREELEIAERLARVRMSPTRRFDGDSRPTITGMATPGLIIPEFEEVNRLLSTTFAEIQRLNKEFGVQLTAETRARHDALLNSSMAAAEGLLGLDRAMGFLPDSARQAVQGITDMIRGIQNIQDGRDEEGALGMAQQIGGYAGLAAGIVQLGKSIFGGASEAEKEIEAARGRAEAALKSFTGGFTGFASEVDRATEVFQAQLEAFVRSLSKSGKFTGLDTTDLALYAEVMQSASLTSAEALDVFARAAARLGDKIPGLVELTDSLAQKLNDAREPFLQRIEFMRVEALYGSDAVRILREQIQMEEDLAFARQNGIDVGLVYAAWEAFRANQQAAENQRKEDEWAREQADKDRTRDGLLGRTARDEAQLQGLGPQYDAQQTYNETIRQATEALGAGAITQEEFAWVVDVAGNVLKNVLGDIAVKAAEAEQARLNEMADFNQWLELQGLYMDGKDEEAKILERSIFWQGKYNEALALGMGPEVLAEIIRLQNKDIQKIQDGFAADELIKSTQGGAMAAREAEANMRTASFGGLADVTSIGAIDYLRQQLDTQRMIERNTRAGGGSRQGGGIQIIIRSNQDPAEIAQQVAAALEQQFPKLDEWLGHQQAGGEQSRGKTGIAR